MSRHGNLIGAKRAKKDEFYTLYPDVERELSRYGDRFRDKTVYCNCDDPERSSFWLYFRMNFGRLGLRKLISTHYARGGRSYKLEYASTDARTELSGDGDFRSGECAEVLKACDIVVTNPPFSLFREYVSLLMEYGKKFIIVGSVNAVTYQEFFPLLRDNKVWAGFTFNRTFEFMMPDEYELKGRAYIDAEGRKRGFVPGICFYTNVDIDKRHEPLALSARYGDDPCRYRKYYNFDAINVDRVSDIPYDYDGAMGVPITFMDRYCPEQFEIIGLGMSNLGLSAGVKPYLPEHRAYRRDVQRRGQADGDLYLLDDGGHPVVPYARILIRRAGHG